MQVLELSRSSLLPYDSQARQHPIDCHQIAIAINGHGSNNGSEVGRHQPVIHGLVMKNLSEVVEARVVDQTCQVVVVGLGFNELPDLF